jgi:hypothetical protein
LKYGHRQTYRRAGRKKTDKHKTDSRQTQDRHKTDRNRTKGRHFNADQIQKQISAHRHAHIVGGVRMCVCVCVCAFACMRACVRACVRVCVCRRASPHTPNTRFQVIKLLMSLGSAIHVFSCIFWRVRMEVFHLLSSCLLLA